MDNDQKQIIRRAMSSACGDDLERANHAFGRMTDAQLDKEWGASGKTCRVIWQEYKDHRARWQGANDALEALLK